MKSLSEKGGPKAVAASTIYTIAGALVLNGVLQILIYPRLTAEMGAERAGAVLYVMAFVNILGPSIGQALNNSRLVLRREHQVTNGDYDTVILLLTAVGTVGAFIFSFLTSPGALLNAVRIGCSWLPLPAAVILAAVLILLTVFRYYGDVEYRLTLEYRKYFIYYVLIGAGYAAGYLLFRLTGMWILIFPAGEAAGLLYLAFRGRLFQRFFQKSPFYPVVLARGTVLVLSYFITNLSLNIDRLFLAGTLGNESVTLYYTVSLIGKTLVLFVAPINTVVISYITKKRVRFDRKLFLRFTAVGVGVSLFFFILCEIGTPIFLRLFYPTLKEAAGPYITVVNISQILAILSAFLFIVVLTFTGERWQLLLQGGHLALVLILITLMTRGGGMRGFSYGILTANAVRVAAVVLLGFLKAKGDRDGNGV